MRVTLPGSNLCSFRLSWTVAGSSVGVFSPLKGEGSEVDLVMVTCTQSWFPEVLGVELFDGDADILEVFCRVPGLVVFWSVTSPLGTVLEVVLV